MATPQNLTEYERRRLDNIRRNDEMMAALQLRSRAASLLSSSLKRQKTSSKMKSYKEKLETPVIIRRSLRARGMPPDCGVLNDDILDDKPRRDRTPVTDKLESKLSTRGPISMRDAYSAFDSGNEVLVGMILGLANKKCGGIAAKKEGKELEECSRGTLNDSFSEDGRGNMVGYKLVDSGSGIKEEIADNPEDGGKPEVIACVINADGVKDFMERNFQESGNASNSGISVGKSERTDVDECKKVIASGLNDDCKEEIKSEITQGESGKFVDCDSIHESEIGESIGGLRLEEENIARVVPGRIITVKFFPTNNLRMVAVGNKLGNVGFWNMNTRDEEGKGDGIYLYHYHSAHVSGMSIHPSNLLKVYTCCYDGFIRAMDVEKGVFDLVHASEETIYSLSERPDDAQCLFFGEGPGGLNMWDLRVGKSISSWILHEKRINTIDFCSRNAHLLATSSLDTTACIWDLRMMGKRVQTVNHDRAVHSAYFSPSGGYLTTTSFDNTLSIVSGHTFQKTSVVSHNNRTGRWISSFRAIWGWDDSSIFIGNMRRGVDVISPVQNRTVTTLTSPLITAIPCRFSAHPSEVGTLAGATGGGQVYVWTSSNECRRL